MTARRAALPTSHGMTPSSRLNEGLDYPRRLVLRVRAFLGKHLSVRWKLTLWYAFVYALTLLAIGIALPRVLETRNNQLIQAGLQRTADRILPLLAQTAAGPPRPYHGLESCGRFQQYCSEVQQTLNLNSGRLSEPGQFEQVQLYDFKTGLSPLILPAGQEGVSIPAGRLANVASSGQPTYEASVGGKALAAYFTPITPPPGLRKRGAAGLLEVFQPRATYSQIQEVVNGILLLAIPIGILTALFFGWWIARAALRPINRISRTVKAIGESRDLSERLDFVGPRDEVGQLAETFDAMMDRLEKAFETQKRFVADASHELRTPLTAIRGNADLMAIVPQEERDACLTAIRRESERMSRLVTDLLLLAEADVEEQPMQMQPVDLDGLLVEVHQGAVALAAGKVDVLLERVDSATVLGDADRLKQLFLNLVDNAVKFTPAGGTVSISVRSEGHGARIDVSDSGVGIAPEEQRAIFDRFYRVERSRSLRGSGLGLAISSWVVRAHGGTIEVRSELGKGSTFSVFLPAAPSSTASRAAATTHVG